MKKKLSWLIIAVVLIGSLWAASLWNRYRNVEILDLSVPVEGTRQQLPELTVGPIRDRESALAEAKRLFEEQLDADLSDYPYDFVGYDPELDVWLIAGLSYEFGGEITFFGGTVEALIRSNGEVLALYFGK